MNNIHAVSKNKINAFYVSACFLLTACAHNAEYLPSWLTSPLQDTSTTIYGFGQGKSLSEATTAALKNVSTKLGVSVSGSYTQTSLFDELSELHTIHDSVKVELDHTLISSYQQLKNEVHNNSIYTLIKVDKNILIREYNAAFNEVSAGAINHIKSYADDGGIVWVIQAKNILNNDSAIKAKRYAAILNHIDPFNELESISPWATLRRMVVQGVTDTCITFTPENEVSHDFVQPLIDFALSQGYKQLKNCEFIVSVRAQVKDQMYFDRYVSRHNLLLTTKSDFAANITLTSQSVSSFSSARESNLIQLTEKLKGNYLWQSLGFIDTTSK